VSNSVQGFHMVRDPFSKVRGALAEVLASSGRPSTDPNAVCTVQGLATMALKVCVWWISCEAEGVLGFNTTITAPL
jgi:hypothetical protein